MSCGLSAVSRERISNSSLPVATIAIDNIRPALGWIKDGDSATSYEVFEAVLDGMVPRTVVEIGTVLLKLRYASFHKVSLTNLTVAPLAEPAAASPVVLKRSVTDEIVLLANEVKSNFKKVV